MLDEERWITIVIAVLRLMQASGSDEVLRRDAAWALDYMGVDTNDRPLGEGLADRRPVVGQ